MLVTYKNQLEQLTSLNKELKIVGICGGTGSGKTYLTNKLIHTFNDFNIQCIEVDSYYKDLSNLKFEDRAKNNFDHPSSFEFDLLVNDLNNLKKNKNVPVPVYDYKTHTRTNKSTTINNNNDLIILEGIFSLYLKEIRDLLDLCIYIDVKSNIRKERRINRDMENRDRTYNSILNQYSKYVKPMHDQFIHPTKKHADIIIKKINKSDANYSKLLIRLTDLLKGT